MALDFTGLIITVSDLRERIGGPTTNPNSASYVTDAMLQNIIDRKREAVEEIVERKMEALSEEEILTMDVKFDPVDVSVTAGGYVATGNIPSDNLPVPYQVFVSGTGRHLDFDPDIKATADIYNGVLTKYRFRIMGSRLEVLPNTSETIKVLLPTKDEVRHILLAPLIDAMNQEIVVEGRQMIRDRVGVSTGFKAEAVNEGP